MANPNSININLSDFVIRIPDERISRHDKIHNPEYELTTHDAIQMVGALSIQSFADELLLRTSELIGQPSELLDGPETTCLMYTPFSWSIRGRRATYTEKKIRDTVKWQVFRYAAREVKYSQTTFPLSVDGFDLTYPSEVFDPRLVNDKFRDNIRSFTNAGDRVLDMGSGSGINSMIAAQQGAEVVAADIQEEAVEATIHNASVNGFSSSQIEPVLSDGFDQIEGGFDAIFYDPPLSWLARRDKYESSVTDYNYSGLRRFLQYSRRHLNPGGFMLMQFGGFGDISHFHEVATAYRYGLSRLSHTPANFNGVPLQYNTYRVSPIDN